MFVILTHILHKKVVIKKFTYIKPLILKLFFTFIRKIMIPSFIRYSVNIRFIWNWIVDNILFINNCRDYLKIIINLIVQQKTRKWIVILTLLFHKPRATPVAASTSTFRCCHRKCSLMIKNTPEVFLNKNSRKLIDYSLLS